MNSVVETEEKAAALLPCPFCLGPADISSTVNGDEGDGYMWRVFCAADNDCGVGPDIYRDSERVAVDHWNLRKASDSVRVLAEGIYDLHKNCQARESGFDVEAIAQLISAWDTRSSAWQAIDSAPKDGRTILLGYTNRSGNWRTLRGQWYSDDMIAMDWEDPDEGEEGWYETSVQADDPPNVWPVTPTHWQPLPTAPEQKTEETK